MDFTENQSSSFHQRQKNGNTHSKSDQEINYNSEHDLAHDVPLNSIFVTDSSKNFSTNMQNISSDWPITSTDSG